MESFASVHTYLVANIMVFVKHTDFLVIDPFDISFNINARKLSLQCSFAFSSVKSFKKCPCIWEIVFSHPMKSYLQDQKCYHH